MNRSGTSYLLWLAIFAGMGGLHRLYNGKVISGLLWLFTGGFFGIGQLIDLLLIPGMVDDYHVRRLAKYGAANAALQPAITRTVPQPKPEELSRRLLKAAQKRQGKLSVTQGVMDTGASFTEVEAELVKMAKKGYADIQNDPVSGAVVYAFPEL